MLLESVWTLPYRILPLVAVFAIAGCAAPIRERQVSVLEEAPVAGSQNYKLATQDVVRVEVFQEPDMLTEQRIAQDGTINISLAGRVKIGGLTVDQAGDAIAAKLREGFLVNPQVTVNVTEYAPRRFSVLGQVNTPGSFEIPGEDFITLPTAIAMAQGNTRIGNLRRVLVTRIRDGKVYDITVNVLSPEGRQFLVKKGDMIMVPESLF